MQEQEKIKAPFFLYEVFIHFGQLYRTITRSRHHV